MNKYTKRSLTFLLPGFLIAADQITKKLIIDNIPNRTIGYSLWNGFLRIIHTRNLGVAFSWGDSVPNIVRVLIFIIVPLFVMIGLVVYILRTDSITGFQRWAMAGILGGGIGNLIDRIFRPEGVVDFIDVKFYGLFGWERFPTFNVADSSIVVFGILLFISFVLEGRKKNEQES